MKRTIELLKLDLVQAAAKHRAVELQLSESRLAMDRYKFELRSELAQARTQLTAALAKITTLECAAAGQQTHK